MSSFIIPIVLSVFFIVLTIALLFKSLHKTNRKKKYEIWASICTALATLISILNISVPQPIIYPLNGDSNVYDNKIDVTIKSDLGKFSKIYYSLDGTDPKIGVVYDKPISVDKSITVSAKSKFFWCWSDVVKESYNFKEKVYSEEKVIEENETVETDEIVSENNLENNNAAEININIGAESKTEAISKKQNMSDNDIIKAISLGMNKEYINEFLGSPQYEFNGKNLSNAFYLLESKNVVIRCIFNEDSKMVGYIVTVKNIDADIEFPDPMYNGNALKYGVNTIYDTEYDSSSDKIELANLGNAACYNYFWQCNHLLSTGYCDGFIVAILPYGFYEKDYEKLMMSINYYNEYSVEEEEEIIKLKKYLHPNTYGIIDLNYKYYIYPCMRNEYEYEDEFDGKDIIMYWESCVKYLSEN